MKRISEIFRASAFCALALALGAQPKVGLAKGFNSSIAVADRVSGTITLISTRTDTATTIPMPAGDNPAEPMYVVYSPIRDRVFVGDRANNRVVVFRGRDFSVETTVPAGAGVFHMWQSVVSRQLWVNNDIDNTITVIDTQTLNVLATIPTPADLTGAGAKPHDVILDPIARFAYVTMIGVPGPDVVLKYSTTTFAEVDRQNVGEDPHLSLTWRNHNLYVPCQGSDAVFVLDRNSLDVELQIPVPNAHGAGMARSGARFYTTNISGGGPGGLVAIDTGANSVVGSTDTPFPTPHNIALTPNGKKIYVTHSGAAADKVSVYTTKPFAAAPELLTTVDVGLNPFGLAFVP